MEERCSSSTTPLTLSNLLTPASVTPSVTPSTIPRTLTVPSPHSRRTSHTGSSSSKPARPTLRPMHHRFPSSVAEVNIFTLRYRPSRPSHLTACIVEPVRSEPDVIIYLGLMVTTKDPESGTSYHIPLCTHQSTDLSISSTLLTQILYVGDCSMFHPSSSRTMTTSTIQTSKWTDNTSNGILGHSPPVVLSSSSSFAWSASC